MNKPFPTEKDAESAYGSEVSSNSNFILKKGSFSIGSSAPKKNVWCRWIKQKAGEFMIFECFLLVTIVFLIINTYNLSSQNQETQAMILTLQSQLNSFQKQPTGSESGSFKNEMNELLEMSYKKIRDILFEVLKEVWVKPNARNGYIQQQHKSSSFKNDDKVVATPEVSIPPTNSTLVKFNVASLIAGAKVDTDRSSPSNMNPYIGYDQSSIVLVDRPEPPADKAWCTYEKEPVLTVNLAKYVKPTSVSYQQSNWKIIAPVGTPKLYDVVTCFDYYCEKWEPLVSNCEYSPYGRKEQFCEIPSNATSSPIGKVQFRFRKNHGNVEKTCVSIVRVYADIEQKQKDISLDDSKICSELKHNYHHNPFTYNYFDYKNCTVLYSKGCCTECPECCEQCDAQDINRDFSKPIVLLVLMSPILLPSLALCIMLIVASIWECCKR